MKDHLIINFLCPGSKNNLVINLKKYGAKKNRGQGKWLSRQAPCKEGRKKERNDSRRVSSGISACVYTCIPTRTIVIIKCKIKLRKN